MYFFEKNGRKANRPLIEQIILEKYNSYYRLAYCYVRSEADAFDIVQNGAYKAIKNSHTLKQPEYAETWIYRIMLNECFQNLKQAHTVSYEELPEKESKAVKSAEESCANLDLERALASLSEKDCAIIILKYFEDKKLEEIADILEENINTVKSRLYRALEKLRKMLSADNYL